MLVKRISLKDPHSKRHERSIEFYKNINILTGAPRSGKTYTLIALSNVDDEKYNIYSSDLNSFESDDIDSALIACIDDINNICIDNVDHSFTDELIKLINHINDEYFCDVKGLELDYPFNENYFNTLSLGMKRLLTMLFEVLLTKKESCTYLIDDVELHLSEQWMEKILHSMYYINNRCQVICTTKSSIITKEFRNKVIEF